MKDATHDADDSDEQEYVSITFGDGGRIIYDQTNGRAWIQAEEEAVVDVVA